MPLKDPIKRAAYHKQYMKKWYVENRKKQQALVRRNQARLKDRIADFKMRAGCTDCGYSEHAAALDFDHVRGTKSMNVSRLHTFGSWHRIMKEIAKCEVVCANCHRVRTATRNKPDSTVVVA